MDKQYFQELLAKYENNQLNDDEKKIVDAWYDSFENSEPVSPLQNQATKQNLYRSLQNQLHLHIANSQVKIKKMRWPYAVAASLLVALSFALVFRSFRLSNPVASNTVGNLYKITTHAGELKKIVLPDSSTIWINACSQLSFNAKTFAEKRDIFLNDGEAFFKVTKNPKSPFRVHTSTITTQVFGTSFNVRAYRELTYAAVYVKTGRVGVTHRANPTGVMLTANQFTIYDKTLKTLTSNASGGFNADSWITGTIAIKNASFHELAMILYNHYNIRFSSRDSKVLKYNYTITIFPNTSLDRTLKLLCAIHHNHYRRNQNEVIIY